MTKPMTEQEFKNKWGLSDEELKEIKILIRTFDASITNISDLNLHEEKIKNKC